MPSASRLARALRHRGLARATRAGLLRAEVARRTRARAAYAVPLGPATIYLSHDDRHLARAGLSCAESSRAAVLRMRR